jgi:hypothetical protein
MATGTSSVARRGRSKWLALGGLALIAGVAALVVALSSPAGARANPAFSWLRPAAPAAGWKVATTTPGARLAYPPTWRSIETDAGTASAAPARGGVFRGYLNATPKAGGETLANWHTFRVAHLGEEGDHSIHQETAAAGLAFRGGHGSCVVDTYSTSATRFREIACIVAGAQRTTVVIAAAPVASWHAQAPLLEQAVARFTA